MLKACPAAAPLPLGTSCGCSSQATPPRDERRQHAQAVCQVDQMPHCFLQHPPTTLEVSSLLLRSVQTTRPVVVILAAARISSGACASLIGSSILGGDVSHREDVHTRRHIRGLSCAAQSFIPAFFLFCGVNILTV